MAYHRDITEADRVFYDTDLWLSYTIYVGEPSEAEILAGTAVPADVTGWTFSWVLKRKAKNTIKLIEKLSGVSPTEIEVIGIYNADPALNTQRVRVRLEDTDTYNPIASPAVDVKPGSYVYGLKRTDAGFETILVEGAFKLRQAAPWE